MPATPEASYRLGGYWVASKKSGGKSRDMGQEAFSSKCLPEKAKWKETGEIRTGTYFAAGGLFPRTDAHELHVRCSLSVWYGILIEYLEMIVSCCWEGLGEENKG